MIVGSSDAVTSNSFIQERETFNQRVIQIHLNYHHYNSIFGMLTYIFCNKILHTHIVLHLFLISKFSDCLSLINTKFRIEQDGSAKLNRKNEEETVWKS